MKRLLILLSVFSIVVSSAFIPASAQSYTWELVGTYDAEYVKNNSTNQYLFIGEDGYLYYDNGSNSSLSSLSILNLGIGNEGIYKIEAVHSCSMRVRYRIREEGESMLSQYQNFSNTYEGTLFVLQAVSLSPTAGFKSATVWKQVPVPFGSGGLSGDSSDLSYAVSLLGTVFDGLWNLVTGYWWVMILLCLPLAYWIACLFIDFVANSRVNKGKRRYGILGFFNSFRDKIDEKRREKYANRIFNMSDPDKQPDYVKIDGHIYYNPRYNVKDNAHIELGKFRKNVIYADVYHKDKRDNKSQGKE